MMKGLFKELTVQEHAEYIAQARRTYVPGDPIDGVWHPVYQLECVLMNVEAADYSGYLQLDVRHD